MNQRFRSFACLVLLVPVFFGCLSEENKTELSPIAFNSEEFAIVRQHLNIGNEIESFPIDLPRHMQVNGRSSEVIPAQALLGRVLFYDIQLSATGETSCGSCHKQDKAFSDDVAFSHGINNQLTKRNSLALAAVPNFEASYDNPGGGSSVEFFWDERAGTIALQSRETIENTIEMGRNIDELAADLSQQELYRILAQKAFQTTELRPDHIVSALETFCNALVSTNSRFDRLMDQEIFGEASNNEPMWTPEEQRGRALYNRDCASCHSFDMSFPGRATANNGLDVNYEDQGKGELFGSAFDGIFKVPFLRNIELTAPYMHDGRFATLDDVLNHYSTNISNHTNLNGELKDNNGQPKRLNYTDEDKAAIIKFLKSTTDNVLPQVERFSDPFAR